MTLQERLEKVMEDLKWDQPRLRKEAKVSSSVVSQWLGKGSKVIKSIGNMAAAYRLAEASGFSALWIAKGEGAMMSGQPPAYYVAAETPSGILQEEELLVQLGLLLATVPAPQRRAVGELLRNWAEEAGADHYRLALQAVLHPRKAQLHA